MCAVDDERETEYRHQLLGLCRFVRRHGQPLPPGAHLADLTHPIAPDDARGNRRAARRALEPLALAPGAHPVDDLKHEDHAGHNRCPDRDIDQELHA